MGAHTRDWTGGAPDTECVLTQEVSPDPPKAHSGPRVSVRQPALGRRPLTGCFRFPGDRAAQLRSRTSGHIARAQRHAMRSHMRTRLLETVRASAVANRRPDLASLRYAEVDDVGRGVENDREPVNVWSEKTWCDGLLVGRPPALGIRLGGDSSCWTGVLPVLIRHGFPSHSNSSEEKG